ncbi:hypothetical protein [Pseudomonas sp. NA-150]|uniref:hypothetical protein n=1 Tax=Pseudomonas sp. NA-150 TaxID=3367525 RepID=UPI0037C5CBA3
MSGFGTIKNPLTIIAIFAGIVEVSSTTVLPFINEAVQSIYIWFLMLFPSLLVLTFFITLNWNSSVLYAPSDFQSDDGYHKANKMSVSLRNQINSEVKVRGFFDE